MAEHRYDPAEIEPRWQAVWAAERTWEVSNEPDPEGREPSYVLEMLPYPSGEPHMGHLKVYSIGDAIAHFHRRTGRRVLHPMGYDAFGLPAENHAIRTGEHPRVSTAASIASFQRQFHAWGISIDWSRELATCEPDYYRWTQWIFLRLLEAGLAERRAAAVNWCPNDQTVLANEQVVDGRCERCGAEVELRDLTQWFLKITAYADRLLEDLGTIAWPENVVTMQRNWIGRSRGAQVTFSCEELGLDFPVFTTRPDTLFGATFFVLAPEHPEVVTLVAGTGHEAAVREYVERVGTESAEQRGAEDREKTGVATGRTVTNPVNGERIPVYVADYVLMEYGTGAVMAVPGHDERDFAFAQVHDLPVRRVVQGGDGELPYTGDGPLVNSAPEFDGLPNREALERIVAWLDEQGRGHATTNYRLRDWLISRQRYWGCPIPVVHCDACGVVAVPEADLPVELPEVDDFAPQGRSPLAAAEQWVNTTCPSCGGPARRETDTMDTFVDSSWYFLRYCDARYDADTARCYVLFIGPPDQDADWSDEGVEGVHRFLSRLWRLGAETAQGTQAGPVPSAPQGDDLVLLRKAHWAIAKVTDDMGGRFAFNTAIAAIMELTNECSRLRESASPGAMRFALATAASLLFPFAPHAGADVYERLTGEHVWEQPWPQADPALLARDVFELVCQVNGKVRDRVEAPSSASREDLLALARAAPNVVAHVDGHEVVKEVVVPGRLVNIVVR